MAWRLRHQVGYTIFRCHPDDLTDSTRRKNQPRFQALLDYDPEHGTYEVFPPVLFPFSDKWVDPPTRTASDTNANEVDYTYGTLPVAETYKAKCIELVS